MMGSWTVLEFEGKSLRWFLVRRSGDLPDDQVAPLGLGGRWRLAGGLLRQTVQLAAFIPWGRGRVVNIKSYKQVKWAEFVVQTDSEVDVSFSSAHDQVRLGLGRCRIRGFRRRFIRAWICTAWRRHRLTWSQNEIMQKVWKMTREVRFVSTHRLMRSKWQQN